MSAALEIRRFESKEDYRQMIDYFLLASHEYLRGMGADPEKFPTREQWLENVWEDHHKPGPERDRIYLAWIYNGQLVGHSSVNRIQWVEEASIHLHLWQPELRRKGIGAKFFCRSVNYFLGIGFRKIFCEPHAENPAPNKVLSKLGFKFIRRYRTMPTSTSLEHEVNRWEIDHVIPEETQL